MVKALEDTTEAVARRQLQDMLNNAITEPDKFHNLGLRIKSSNVGKNTGLPKTTFSLLLLLLLLLSGWEHAPNVWFSGFLQTLF